MGKQRPGKIHRGRKLFLLIETTQHPDGITITDRVRFQSSLNAIKNSLGLSRRQNEHKYVGNHYELQHM